MQQKIRPQLQRQNITEAELDQFLKAAYAAPVGMKAYDTLIMTVVTSQSFMDKMNVAAADMMGRPDAVPLYGAPTLIIVFSTLPGGARDNVVYSNAACIVENIALEAMEWSRYLSYLGRDPGSQCQSGACEGAESAGSLLPFYSDCKRCHLMV